MDVYYYSACFRTNAMHSGKSCILGKSGEFENSSYLLTNPEYVEYGTDFRTIVPYYMYDLKFS